MMTPRVAFQMDHISSLNIEGDTTFALCLEAQNRNYKIFHYTPEVLTYENGIIRAPLESLEVNDDNIPRGFIISQNPVAGTKMSPGSTVDLVVSKGPSLIKISDLSRKSPEDAIQILETLGFEYELIEEYSEDVEIGLVSGTLPEVGEIVAPDQVIQVIVSLGIKIEVPEVEGLNYEDAIKVLEELNLVVTVNGETNGIVRKQIPRKGEFLEPEGVVELTFGN